MTISAGHPDWQSYVSWRGPPIVSNPALGLPGGGLNLGITAIPHWATVTVHAVATNRIVDVIVAFYADAGGTTIVESVEFSLPVGAAVSVVVPALGPFVQVIVNNRGAAAGAMQLFVQPCNLPAPVPAYISSSLSSPLAIASGSVASGGGLTVVTGEIYAGPVVVGFNTSSGTAYHGSVSYWDQAAQAFLIMMRFIGTAQGQGGALLLAAPASQMQASISNDDTVARTLTVTLTRAA